MKKLIICTLVLFVGISFSQAQNSTTNAKDILDQVSAKTKSYANIKIAFTFTHETKNTDEGSESSEGSLQLKGNKYQLKLMGNVLYCDGKTLWTHMIEEKETTIQNIEGEEEGYFNPAKMLTIYEDGYKYKFIQERFEKGRAVYIIDLYPKDVDKSEFSRIRLTIDKDKSQLRMIEYFSKDQNKYIITVNSFDTSVVLPESTFIFDKTKFPGVVLIDER